METKRAARRERERKQLFGGNEMNRRAEKNRRNVLNFNEDEAFFVVVSLLSTQKGGRKTPTYLWSKLSYKCCSFPFFSRIWFSYQRIAMFYLWERKLHKFFIDKTYRAVRTQLEVFVYSKIEHFPNCKISGNLDRFDRATMRWNEMNASKTRLQQRIHAIFDEIPPNSEQLQKVYKWIWISIYVKFTRHRLCVRMCVGRMDIKLMMGLNCGCHTSINAGTNEKKTHVCVRVCVRVNREKPFTIKW